VTHLTLAKWVALQQRWLHGVFWLGHASSTPRATLQSISQPSLLGPVQSNNLQPFSYSLAVALRF